jgi:hypothetical protein
MSKNISLLFPTKVVWIFQVEARGSLSMVSFDEKFSSLMEGHESSCCFW